MKEELFNNETKRKETGEPAYEHLIYRIKSEDSMREKCQRKSMTLVVSVC